MLYVTTRSNRDVFTAHRILGQNRAEDGGFYVPFHEPVFTPEDLERLSGVPFNQRIADVLNLLFQTGLTGWDVDFSVGRKPAKLVSLGHRIVVGEFWHNPDWDFRRMEAGLSALLQKDDSEPGSWIRIAVRIAVLVAVILELRGEGILQPDVAVVSGDFLWPISAWYARKWGLPLGNIVICCNENQNLWDLICHGQFRTDSVSLETQVPEADISVPAELERLICGCGGRTEVIRYLDCCRRGVMYFAEDPMLRALQKGNFVSVVSSTRMRDTIPGVLRTHGYMLSAGSALAYAGLLDYRARKGSLAPALVIGEKSPLGDADRIGEILQIPPERLSDYM